jgi:hypothetical protein
MKINLISTVGIVIALAFLIFASIVAGLTMNYINSEYAGTGPSGGYVQIELATVVEFPFCIIGELFGIAVILFGIRSKAAMTSEQE